MKRVFLCLSHPTHLLKHISKLIHVTFWFDGKFYSRTCSGVDLLSGVHTNRCQLLHLLSRTVNEVNNNKDPFRLNDWAVTEGKRLSDPGGQWTFGVSEGVAPAPYSATRSRRAMYFWGLRGGSTGSLLCNAIRRLRRRKRKTKRFGFVPNKRWRLPIRVVHFQSYSIEGQSVSCIAGKCVSANKCLRALRG